MPTAGDYENETKILRYNHDRYTVETKDFLDFLSVAYKVIKVIENDDDGKRKNMADFGWDLILHNKLVSSLFASAVSPVFDSLLSIIDNDYSISYSHSNTNFIASVIKQNKSIVRSKTENCIKLSNRDANNNCNQLQLFFNSKSNVHYARIVLINKLNEILEEGILDSILTYIVPRNSINGTSKISTKQDHAEYIYTNKYKRKERKKKSDQTGIVKSNINTGDEVEIHVYDEIKGFKKDFKCSQSLLVSKMGYFSEVSKGQKLDEMDISVHCDITIFDWLMRWIKHDSHIIQNKPNLDSKNVVPIMVSANFLQMELLFHECLNFCKINMNEVIKYSSNLSCLSDNILKRLADLLSNVEVQTLKDKKDKIRSRLFCKLITSLNEVIPVKKRGHYASMAYLYFCLYCGKLVTKLVAPYVPCQIQYITITYKGDVTSHHFRDPRWNLNDHIRKLWIQYKNWGRTYWRLWSQCHFLYCYLCNTMYAVEFSDCCPYHPQQPHFYPMEQFQTTNSPIGRYPCCGSKALRYETVFIPSQGCKLRSHTPKLQSNDDTHIQNIIATFPELVKQNDISTQISTVFNYSGNENDKKILSTYKEVKDEEFNLNQSRSGLVSNVWNNAFSQNVPNYNGLEISWKSSDACFQDVMTDIDNDVECISVGESENSDNVSIKESIIDSSYSKCGIIRGSGLNAKYETKPVWSSKYTIRHNQDNQRDYEELVFRTMSQILFQRPAEEQTTSVQSKKVKSISAEQSTNIFGGTYQQIETEWRERHKLKTQSTSNSSRK